jgi:hypothetical protein
MVYLAQATHLQTVMMQGRVVVFSGAGAGIKS